MDYKSNITITHYDSGFNQSFREKTDSELLSMIIRGELYLRGDFIVYKYYGYEFVINAETELFNRIKGLNRKESKIKKDENSPDKTQSNKSKYNLYMTLLKTIKSRESQLKKMANEDSKRELLENELSVVRIKAQKMKEKYNF